MKTFCMFFVVMTVIAVSFSAYAETEVTEMKYDAPTCTAPIARIALGKIGCKASQCKKSDLKGAPQALIAQLASLSGQASLEGIGEGLGDMLLTVLKQTGCFEVLERENIEELKQELALMGKELKDVAVADYLIGGSVTSIKMENKTTSIGFGLIPVIGSVDFKKTMAILAMDMRLIDVNSTKVLNTRTYEAQSGKSSTGIGGGTLFGNVGFGAAFTSLQGTALEEVARDIVIRAAKDLIVTVQQAKGVLPHQIASETP